MPLSKITSDTLVSFPAGETVGRGRVIHTQMHSSGRTVVVTDETPFHPLSHSWPDQQADTGEMELDGRTIPITDSLTAAIQLGAETLGLYIDKEIPVRKPGDNWVFVVAHIISMPDDLALEAFEDKEVLLRVNAERRLGLSATHTATHLAALAMNKATDNLWKKEASRDTLGNRDLDKLAMQKSVITPTGCTDHYRFGKSLRKNGFDSAAFLDQLPEMERRVSDQVQQWISTGEPVTILASGPTLESERWMKSRLDGAEIRFPCGGTHIQSLAEYESISISFERIEELPEIRMRTVPHLAS